VAKSAFEKGKTAFKEKRFIMAADSFREAYELKPTWKLLYNVGHAEAAGKRFGLALEAFEQYLFTGGDEVSEERQTSVQKEIARLKGMVGSLEVRAPTGSLVEVDEVERGTAPLPGKIRIAAGVIHRLVVRSGNEVLLDRSIRVGSGESSAIEVEQAGQATTAPKEPETATEPQDEGEPEPSIQPASKGEEPSRLRPVGWAVLGVGAAAVVAGSITGGMTMAKAGDLDESCPDKLCSDSERDIHESAGKLATATNVLLPVGAALAVTGLMMVIFGGDDEERDPTPGSSSTRGGEMSVLPGPGGLIVYGRF
jgi:hypothetical protein